MLHSPLKSTPEREAKRLIRLLTRRKTNWHTEPSLRQLTPAQIIALQEYIAHWHSEMFLTRFLALLCIIFVFIFGVIGISLAVIPLVMALYFGIARFCNLTLNDYRYAVYALTQTEEMRVLPTLIQATRHGWGRHPQVQAAILRMLEQLTDAPIDLLTNAEQNRLWTVGVIRQIQAEQANLNIARRTLHALAAVGNQSTLTRMKHFVNHSEHFTNANDLIAEAQRLIPVMEARLHRQQSPQTLLRAADMPANQLETLLRPTYATTPEPSGQLLRASTGEAREP